MSQHVGSFFSNMEEYIASSRAAVAAGDDLDMAGLDNAIETLCDMIQTMPAGDQQLYEPRLQDLLMSLNALGQEMKAQAGLQDIPKHRNASVAYKTADSRDNFGKRDDE